MRKYKRWIWVFLLVVLMGTMFFVYHQARSPEVTAEAKATKIAKKYAKLENPDGFYTYHAMARITQSVVKIKIKMASMY